jgi:short-subunit dehydrogenase
MKTTLITGASGGIGEALASRFAERKHNLLLVARNATKLEAQCRQLTEKYGIQAQYIAADLATPAAPVQIFAETQQRGLEVAVLINNAGIGSGGEFSQLALDAELGLIQLNISALVALTHLFLPPMQARKSGTIVNVASMAAFMPIPYMATYAASKAFVRSFTEAITQECTPHNVQVLLLFPGLTKTNFNEAAGLTNEVGKGLNTEYTSATQTPEQVADEALKALDAGKQAIISGRMNRLGAKMLALVPGPVIAKSMANNYRKKMGL